MELVHGTKNKLNLGYCMVRNRGQQDKALSSTDRHQIERHFFSTSPWSALDKRRVGIPALQDRLRELLVDITRREFPNVKHEIDRKLSDCEQKLKALGPARETDDQQRTFLLDLATEFQGITSNALDAYYSRSSLFNNNSSLRLATRIVDLDTMFSDDVWLKGHTRDFSKSTTREGDESVNEPSPEEAHSEGEPLEDDESAASTDISRSTRDDKKFDATEFPELADVVQAPWRCPGPLADNIFDWIESEYRTSRGFELGTFDPSLLPIIFQE